MNTLTGFVIGVAIVLVLVALVASRNWDAKDFPLSH